MKFLKNQRVPMLFKSAKLHKDGEDNRTALLTFRVKLNGNNVRSTPKFIQLNYQTVKDLEAQSKKAVIDGVVESQFVELFNAEALEKPSLKIESCDLKTLSIERGKENIIELEFSLVVDLSAKISSWIFLTFGSDIWAQFSEAQGELSDAGLGDDSPQAEFEEPDSAEGTA